MAINKDLRDKIIGQVKEEITFSRKYRAGKIKNWQKNEEMYYGTKKPTDSSRANVDLGKMQEFVHTLLSKINTPLIFKYAKRKDAQLSRAERANAVRENDRKTDWWDMKDLAGKKQCAIYGRAIYTYYADSIDGIYQAHLENVDVYDFLIDPAAGGLDIEKANYMGRYGVIKSKSQLRQGVKDKYYLKYEVDNLVNGSANATEWTTEELNKQPRRRDQNVWTTQTEVSTTQDYKFWEWYTTYDGERYYLLITNDGNCVRMEKLTDIFPATKQHPMGAFPFWTYAAFIDLTEFWTPSFCDYVREIFMAQAVSINQMLDNGEQINKPQRIVNVTAIENLASLKYRKEGVIVTKGNIPIKDAYQTIDTPSIQTPLMVYDKLEVIGEKASGVTAGAKGTSKDTVVSVYEGNQEAIADRFKLFQSSYSFGYTRFGILHQEGMRTNLTKRIAIDIIGPEGIEQQMVTKRDIFRKDEDLALFVESSNAQEMLTIEEKKNKITFLTQESGSQIINPKKFFEIKARISGFTDDEIRQMLDTSEFGDSKLMSEADRDIESILDGKFIKPNRMATTAYKQRFVNFMLDHEEDMNETQKVNMFAYIDTLNPIILENMQRKINEKVALEAEMMTQQQLSMTSDQRDVQNQSLPIQQ